MSLHLDYAEISRQARRIVDANRARSVLQATEEFDQNQPRKRVKFSRSTKGCLACRQHKVKCDETTPTCLRCVAGQRECEYPSVKDSNEKRKSVSGNSRRRSETSASVGAGAGPSEVSGAGNGEKTNGTSERSGSPSQLSPSEIFNIPSGGILGSSQSPATKDQNYISPDLSFLNDLLPDFNPNMFSPSAFLPQTSPSQTLPVNWDPPASSSTPAVATLPQFANLGKSALLSRRVGKGKEAVSSTTGKASTPSSILPPRMAVIDGLLQALVFDEALFEYGPSHRQRALTASGGLGTSTDVLTNAFPSSTARTLFHHYCNVTSRILITMGNIGPNPLLALCTPLRLLDTKSAASAAMRMSMLSTSVAHFAHETEEHMGLPNLGAAWAHQKAQLRTMSEKFKKAALSNITLSASSDNGTHQIDTLLAACTLLCIRDVLLADTTWRDNMEFALNLIAKKGGPQAMLKPTEYSFTRRYLLENLATHDVFSSFITGKEPALLGNYDSWWFDSVETSTTRWEWESVERTFGISRAMVDLVARIAVLDSHKRRLGISLKGHPDELWDAGQHFIRESHCLLLELDIWGNSLNALPQHFRVTCGDYIYKYMAVVYILGDILEQPTTTPRIVAAVNHVLELCSEASAMRMSVMLIWPLLIAGVFCVPTTREKVRSLFDAFHSDYCEDLEAARALLEEQWRCIDAGEGKRPWNEVMKKLDKNVLLI